MDTQRFAVKKELSAQGIEVRMTYGYITKYRRIRAGLEKSHCTDARVISGHPKAEPLGYYFLKKKARCHNRQIHKVTIGKGGYRNLTRQADMSKDVNNSRLKPGA